MPDHLLEEPTTRIPEQSTWMYVRCGAAAVSRNIGNFRRGHDEYAVGAGFSSFVVALRDVAKFFSEGGAPRVFRDGVSGELVVARNRFACDWMDYGCTEMFDVIIVYVVAVVRRFGGEERGRVP